jgi:hypothetical protein
LEDGGRGSALKFDVRKSPPIATAWSGGWFDLTLVDQGVGRSGKLGVENA